MLLLQKTLDTVSKVVDLTTAPGSEQGFVGSPLFSVLAAIFGGGVGVKILEWLLTSGKNVLQANDNLRKELRENLTELRDEVKKTHDQKVELYEENSELRRQINKLENDRLRLSRRIRRLKEMLLDYDPRVFDDEQDEFDANTPE